MEYILGALMAVVFFSLVALSLWVGYKFGQRKKPPDIDENELMELEKLNKDFEKLMTYDTQQALARRKVTE